MNETKAMGALKHREEIMSGQAVRSWANAYWEHRKNPTGNPSRAWTAAFSRPSARSHPGSQPPGFKPAGKSKSPGFSRKLLEPAAPSDPKHPSEKSKLPTDDHMEVDSNPVQPDPPVLDLARKLKRTVKSAEFVVSSDEEPPLPKKQRVETGNIEDLALESKFIPAFRIIKQGEPYITRPEDATIEFEKLPPSMKVSLSEAERTTFSSWFAWISRHRPDLPAPTATLRVNATPAAARLPWSVNTLPKGWTEPSKKCSGCLQYYPGRCIIEEGKNGSCMLCRVKRNSCEISTLKKKKAQKPGPSSVPKKPDNAKAGLSTHEASAAPPKAGPSTREASAAPPKAGPSTREASAAPPNPGKAPATQVSGSKPGAYVLISTRPPKPGDGISGPVRFHLHFYSATADTWLSVLLTFLAS